MDRLGNLRRLSNSMAKGFFTRLVTTSLHFITSTTAGPMCIVLEKLLIGCVEAIELMRLRRMSDPEASWVDFH